MYASEVLKRQWKAIPAPRCNHKPVFFSLNNFLPQADCGMDLRMQITPYVGANVVSTMISPNQVERKFRDISEHYGQPKKKSHHSSISHD